MTSQFTILEIDFGEYWSLLLTNNKDTFIYFNYKSIAPYLLVVSCCRCGTVAKW